MNWRYSDHAEQPAEAAEAALPAFDGDAAELDVALVNAVEAILRRRAAAAAGVKLLRQRGRARAARAEYNVAVHDREGRWRPTEVERHASAAKCCRRASRVPFCSRSERPDAAERIDA